MYRKNAGPEARKRHFVWKFTGTMPDPEAAEHVLCEPARSNTRAILRSNLQGKMPDPLVNTSIEHRVLTVTVRTPQCGHAVW